MAQPPVSEVYIDRIQTNLLEAYIQDSMGFVARRGAVPWVSVDDPSGTFFKYSKEYWLRRQMKSRNPGESFARAGYNITPDTYATVQYGVEHPIPDEIAAAAQAPIDLDGNGIEFGGQQLMLEWENRFVSAFVGTGIWTSTMTLGSGAWANSAKWSDYSGSSPVDDVATAQRTVTGYAVPRPDTMVMGRIVKDRLASHPDVLERIIYNAATPVRVVEEALAALFEVRRLLVGDAVYESAAEGATSSLARFLDDDVLIVYMNQGSNVNLLTPVGGMGLYWPDGGGDGQVGRYRDEPTKSDIMRFETQFVFKVVAEDAGIFGADVVD